MKGVPAIYLGRIVDKEHFRVFIYGADGAKKLVQSWDEYEAHMQTGIWFASHEDAKSRIPVNKEPEVKPKQRRAKKVMPFAVEEVLPQDEVLLDNDKVFEVKDDFLPSEA